MQSGCGYGWNHPEASSLPCMALGQEDAHSLGLWGRGLAQLRLLGSLGSLSTWSVQQGRPGQPDFLHWLRALVCMSQEGAEGWEGCLYLPFMVLELTQCHFWRNLSLRSKSLRLSTLGPLLKGITLRNLGYILSHHGELEWLVQMVVCGGWRVGCDSGDWTLSTSGHSADIYKH